MNLLSRAAALGLLAVSLAACSAAQQAAFDATLAKVDATAAKGVDVACTNLPRAELAYTAGVAAGTFRSSKKVADAFMTVKSGCAARAAGADVSGVATSMLLAYLTIKAQVPQVEPLPAGLERGIVLKRRA